VGIPSIDSEANLAASIGRPWSYAPTGSGDDPRWWSLVDAPGDADIDPATGVIAWTPTEAGSFEFTLRLDNESGRDEQSFVVEIVGQGLDWNDVPGETGVDETSAGDTSLPPAGDGGPGSSATSGSGTTSGSTPSVESTGGCGCGSNSGGTWLALSAILSRRRRSHRR
jgi:hypothetical protein